MELSVEQKKELETVERFHTELKKIDHEIRKIIVGQKEVVDQVMISMLTGGHSDHHRRSRPGKDAADRDRRAGSCTSISSAFSSRPT